MDDDDSQNEMINRNVSHGKCKRPVSSILSDEDSNSEEGNDSEEGESNSEEDYVSPVEEEEEEGEEEEEEEDEDADADAAELKGAMGGMAADLAALSSDEDSEKCPICLNSFNEQAVATPESCEHYFCLDCILEWSKNANSCPVDRIVFSNICLRKCYGGKVQKMIPVQKPVKPGQEEQVDIDLEQTSCEVCGGRDREDRLLLCDGCDAGYHMECLTPPLDAVPVEEWFCPECTANNHNTSGPAGQSSEEETSVLPTTSQSRPHVSRPTRVIARTQQSERVRASVNRYRITQARTAQIAPRYLMQSTWLDETINAVVAGLNTAVYVRNLTPRPASRRRRKTVRRRRSKASSSSTSKTGSTGVRKRKRKGRRSRVNKRQAAKKKATAHGRLAKSLGIRKPKQGSSIPSVYRQAEHTLGSMRADIGAASLSIYGDPFDLDSFDDEDEEEAQAVTPSSLLDAKRRGLSRSALRSHQPVARPIPAGLSRSGVRMTSAEEVPEEAPVPDLLGSILTGQSMLLMDSSDVVINRDGSLKATKPVCASSGASTPSGSSSSGQSAGRLPISGGSVFHEEAGLAHNSINQPSSSNSSPTLCPSEASPASAYLPSPPYSQPHGIAQLSPPPPGQHRPSPSNLAGFGPSHWNPSGPRRQAGTRVTNGDSGPHQSGRDRPGAHHALKQPVKPVWVDVSVLPRIPKIKREDGAHSSNNNRRGNDNRLPDSSINKLVENKGCQQNVDQQTTSRGQQGQASSTQRQDAEKVGPSSSFSSTFSSASSLSGSQPSSFPSVNFRINASGSSWHSRMMLGGSCSSKPREKTMKRTPETKQAVIGSQSKADKSSVKSEAYDPSNPTISDSSSSDSASETVASSLTVQSARTGVRRVSHAGRSDRNVSTEPMNLGSSTSEEDRGLSQHVKWESVKAKLGSAYTEQGAQDQSSPLPASAGYSGCPAMSERERGGNAESALKKIQCSRSGTSSSHHSEKSIKTEVKCELKEEPIQHHLSSGLPSGLPQHQQQHLIGRESPSEQLSVASTSEATTQERTSSNVKSKEHRSHSKMKDNRRIRSRSRDRKHPHSSSASEDRQQTHSQCRDRSWHRSRSKERTRSDSRDRKGSSCPNLGEGSTKRESKRGSCELSDSGKKETHKRHKERVHSRSRSRSRSTSRERRHTQMTTERPSVAPKSGLEIGTKSRSGSPNRVSSRDDQSQCSQSKHKSPSKTHASSSKSAAKSSSSTSNISALHGQASRNNKATETEPNVLIPIAHIKKEPETCDVTIGSSRFTNFFELAKKPEDIKQEKTASPQDESTLDQPKQIKQEECFPLEIKQEGLPFGMNKGTFHLMQDDDKNTVPIKQEDISKSAPSASPRHDATCAFLQDKTGNMLQINESLKVEEEPVSPQENDPLLYGDSPLVIDEDSPGVNIQRSETVPCCQESSILPAQSMVPVKMEVESPAAVTSINDDMEMSDDEDLNVDYLLDNLDLIKTEMKECKVTDATVTLGPQAIKQEAPVEEKLEKEVTAGQVDVKPKSHGKRVTWNLQEPEGPQPEKSSKLALFKLKLKQEGSRKFSSSAQTLKQDEASVSSLAQTAPSTTACASQDEAGEGSSRSHGEKPQQDLHQKDMYLRKLHMQERAIEEVKLAIKPFYQKRDITKEEYKEILRKAVQKVCHSKSGEINPVKVANLVKAYVDKYKHARKHRREEKEAEGQEVAP